MLLLLLLLPPPPPPLLMLQLAVQAVPAVPAVVAVLVMLVMLLPVLVPVPVLRLGRMASARASLRPGRSGRPPHRSPPVRACLTSLVMLAGVQESACARTPCIGDSTEPFDWSLSPGDGR